MFAVELKRDENIKTLQRILRDVEKICLESGQVTCVERIELETHTTDYENGEGYLNVMDTVMRFNLIYEDHSPAHLIHTIINSFMMQSGKEKEFYKLMEKLYK